MMFVRNWKYHDEGAEIDVDHSQCSVLWLKVSIELYLS